LSSREISGNNTEDEEAGPDYDDPPVVNMPVEPLPEGVYGFVMASLIKDSADMKTHGMIKLFRILSAFVIYLLMFCLQIFLLYETKQLVSPGEVANARETYGNYEKVMYMDAAGFSHTTTTDHGYARGIDGFFNISNFAKLSPDQRSAICTVPLSQPTFLFCILWIWTLTVLNQVRIAVNLAVRFMYLPTIGSDEVFEQEVLKPTENDGVEVVALPIWLKAALVGWILIPRILMCFFLVWLGARWLTATLGFADVLLNALALAFTLELSELIYNAMIPYHSKLLVQRTFVKHLNKQEPENARTMFSMMLVGVVAAVFALLYIFVFQQVLPAYKWDVSEVCQSVLQKEAAV